MKILITLLILTLFFNFAEALSVYKVKGRKVLISLEGSAVTAGQTLIVVDPNNKPLGSLKVLNINKDKALAEIQKGSAPEGSRLLSSSAVPNGPVGTAKKAAAAPTPRTPYLGSVLLGLASNTLAVKVSDGITSQNVDNTGNSIGVAVAIDRPFYKPWFKLRGLFAYEQFNAIGAATINGCNNQTSKDCQTDIKYLSGGGSGKFENDLSEQFKVWGALGLNIKLPLAKSSTALVASSLGTTLAYGLTAGVDYVLESKNFVTASVEKQFYVKSDSAEISTLFIRVGVGKEF